MIKQKLNCPKMNTLPKDELSGDTKAHINGLVVTTSATQLIQIKNVQAELYPGIFCFTFASGKRYLRY